MKKICVFIFSFIVFVPMIVQGQDSTKHFRSLTLVVGLKGPLIHLLDNNRSTYTAGIDIQFNRNIYFEFSGGLSEYSRNHELYDYKSEGGFLKAGFKYDFLKKQKKESKSITYAGIRFAGSFFEHSAENISFRESYFNNGIHSTPKESMNAFWVEIGGGIRAELGKNFMIGWDVSGAILLKKPEYEYIPPKRIAGFGKGESSFVLDFEYNIAYIIPFYR